MDCPKCGRREQFRNFCDECGTKLRLKCRKCGEMEERGLAYCKTKRNDFLHKYASKKSNFVLKIALALLFLGIATPLFKPFLGLYFTRLLVFSEIIIAFILAIAGACINNYMYEQAIRLWPETSPSPIEKTRK